MNDKLKSNSIRYLKGIGPKKEVMFNRLGVYTLGDLLYCFPLRYEDRRNVAQIKNLKKDVVYLVQGNVLTRNLKQFKFNPWRSVKGKNSLFEAVVEDGTGKVNCAWFNQGYLNSYIRAGSKILIYGKVKEYKGSLQFVSPEFEILGEEEDNRLNVNRIVGVYGLTRGLTQKNLRKTIHLAIEATSKNIQDPLPYHIRKERQLPNLARSVRDIHFPDNFESASVARLRFIFEELFFSQVLVYLRKAKHRSQKTINLLPDGGLVEKMTKSLNFELTDSQHKVIGEIYNDLGKKYPMHRLLQGEVGSGKTVVAAFALGIVAQGGHQAALMVPTEVLAYQHFVSLQNMFNGLGFKIEVLVSGLPGKQKQKIYQGLKEATIDIVVGTHSLIEEIVEFKKLGLVVIDEQHKFGVAQRALLPSKNTKCFPHCLVMSATPIPRSLALSLYGDLDLSVMKELPKGRSLPETITIKENKRKWMYSFLKQKLSEGRQAYIVYPLIEETENWDLKSVNRMEKSIKQEFSGFGVGVFHGKMERNQKEKAVDDFRRNKTQILICTTVIEVGISIENATLMVVESPEHFGLAQLHQLRGRVRRSSHQSYFILISQEGISETAKQRLKVISVLSDGFTIAEEDLKLRGPGDFFGKLQHGMPDLKIANPLEDIKILKEARIFAYNTIKKDPYLNKSVNRCIHDYLFN